MNKELDFINRRLCFLGVERDYKSSKYVVFGVPYDLTSSWRPGARYGPSAIRWSSLYLEGSGYGGIGDVLTIDVHDLGDIVETYSLTTMMKRCFRIARTIAREGKVPVMLGGEHTFSLSCIAAVKPRRVVILDAHLDLRDEYLDRRVCHATWLRRCVEKLGDARYMLLGVRGFERSESEFVSSVNNVDYLTSEEIADDVRLAESKVRSFLGDEPAYLSLDIDVLDPGIAPGVGTPEPGGLDQHSFFRLVRAASSAGLVGLDVVEVCPLFDDGQSAVYAAKALFEAIISSASKSK